MSFDVELAMATLEKMSREELEAVLTAAKFLMATPSVQGEQYAFAAFSVRNIKINQYDTERVLHQNDFGEYIPHYKPVVTISFQCDASALFGTMLKSTAEDAPAAAPAAPAVVSQPLTPEDEEKELENMLARFTVKRLERGDLIHP
jgi:hypothetical protein